MVLFFICYHANPNKVAKLIMHAQANEKKRTSLDRTIILNVKNYNILIVL